MVPWPIISNGVSTVASALIGRAKAPTYIAPPKFDAGAENKKGMTALEGNYAQAKRITDQVNTDSQAQALQLMEQAMPGFSSMQKRLMGLVEGDLNSQYSMPKEMQDQIAQFAAEKGVTRGTAGGFNNFSLVKDFGFSLTDWSNAKRAQALNTLSTVFGMTPRVNPMSPLSMLFTPQQAAGVSMENQTMQWQAKQAYANTLAGVGNYNNALLAGSVAKLGSIVGSMFPTQQPAAEQKTR